MVHLLRSPLLAAATAVLLSLTACGGADDEATDLVADASESTTSTTEATESSDEGEAPETTEAPAADGDAINGGKPEVVIPDGPTPTELELEDVIVGDGKEAQSGDYLVMHYVGVRHADGGQFDASWDRGETFNFVLGAGLVIQGWDQGIVGMKEGGRRVLSIPAELAYGNQERGADIPANSALVFVVDLVGVYTPPEVENAPAPVTELEITVLEEGDGAVIEQGTIVDLHYRAVLQTTGEVFASSWESPSGPARFVVAAEPSQSIPAWDEGLVGRRVGDVIRMVIPPGMGIDDTSGTIPADATIITELTIIAAG